MSHAFDGFPLRPRHGGELQVLIIARISTVHQDPRSLGDQIALCEKYVRDRYPGPVQFTHIQGQGSGEFLGRPELADAEAAVGSARFDLVAVEDIGRVCRRNRAVDFCELCEDTDTRLIAINDSIDTAEDDWRLNAFFATFKHESGNKDTAKRIRRSLRHRFEGGGVVQTLPYGYLKPEGAKSEADVHKDPAAERVYEHIFRKLEAGASYSEVADWMNAERVPTGEWMRQEKWDGRAVARLVHNPILKGYRRRNERKSKRVNRKGLRVSVKAPPEERLVRHVPHLAFIEPARYDGLIAALADRLAACARGRKAGAPDARAGVAKKRTVWPGQHVVCGVCGRPYYWGGHGQRTHMMCSGARDYACWNSATFDGVEAGRRLMTVFLDVIKSLPEFDSMFLARVQQAALERGSSRAERLRLLGRQITDRQRERANLVDAIACSGFSTALQAKLADTESALARSEWERQELLREPGGVPELPQIEELKARARQAVGGMAFDDPALGRALHALMPAILVWPYRALDGGAVVLRAHARVTLDSLLGAAGPVVGDLLIRPLTADLFEPPQRVAYRERVVALRDGGCTEKQAADRLALTVTAAQRAMALHRLMVDRGVVDPYHLLTSPPNGDGKFRRHQHPRYEFRPLAGFPRWPEGMVP